MIYPPRSLVGTITDQYATDPTIGRKRSRRDPRLDTGGQFGRRDGVWQGRLKQTQPRLVGEWSIDVGCMIIIVHCVKRYRGDEQQNRGC